jgi:small-conductance mechanosensitive channel
MKIIMRLFAAVHGLLALVFVGAAIFLLAAAVHAGWLAWQEGLNEKAAQVVIESIGLAAIAVVSLQIAQTIAEEEILRETHVSGPTRVRRFLSRFLVVVIVALAIEGLIATFKALHEDMGELVQASSIVAAVGVILAGWGAFIRLNVPAEKLEPEAMQEAKDEDQKLR